MGHLFKIRNGHNIRISNIHFDINSLDLACQNEFTPGPEGWPGPCNAPNGICCPNKGYYSGACEQRHAISIGGSTDIIIDNSEFKNLSRTAWPWATSRSMAQPHTGRGRRLEQQLRAFAAERNSVSVGRRGTSSSRTTTFSRWGGHTIGIRATRRCP
jgi:hypothetical protein